LVAQQTADPDEAEYGKDIPKPDPPQDVPKVPTLREILRKVGQVDAGDRAGIVVLLPGDARLFLEDQPTHPQTDRSQRLFFTPPLQRATIHIYHARAELHRNGKTVTKTREILLRAGEVALVDFRGLSASENRTPLDSAASVASR
jgi:uncharacterized protein (TIGR03000 family)